MSGVVLLYIICLNNFTGINFQENYCKGFIYYIFYFTGINSWNPAFDVTPGELITGGIITEYGVFKPSELQEKIKKVKSV